MNGQVSKDSLDNAYLEDQIYLTLTYNNMLDKSLSLSQNGFSGGFSAGFIRDIPFNEKRSKGIALGIGYSYDVYIQNLKISKNNFNTNFEFVTDYKTNSLRLHSIDIPFEFRFRNSTINKYKFFRVYAGVKASYIFSSKSVYSDSVEKLKIKNIDEINEWKYGVTLSAGYSTWNLFIYYGLNPIFNDVVVSNESIDAKDLKVGLIFYIM
ncbi:porin family protein [Lutibacter citreus]|uniref:porin family protein n=1 Tax=Lutibacter citreus TaxID=2138210 RepID=UPI001300A012|nr:porin family protein [Lutibacter citreus]